MDKRWVGVRKGFRERLKEVFDPVALAKGKPHPFLIPLETIPTFLLLYFIGTVCGTYFDTATYRDYSLVFTS